MLKSLHSNDCIHQSTKSLISPSVQLLLQDAREAAVEMVPLLLISVYMGPNILCKMVELVHIIHHSHTPLLLIQKLSQLPVQQTSGNILLTESSGKLLPSHTVVRRLHGIESIPPCIGRPQRLLCSKGHLLLFSHSEQLKHLLQNTKRMLRIQRLNSWRECGRACLQEVLVGTGSRGSAGTTPIPAVATRASTGESTNSLGKHLQGTG